jgi:hypothetical protein
MRLVALVTVALVAAASPVPGPQLRLESRPVGTGAELLTVFWSFPEKGGVIDVPLVALLRDTLGDDNPENDRLRYVWVLTSASPTLLQRAAASIPFFYWHPGLGKPGSGKDDGRTPAPSLDLGAVSHPVWESLAGSATQAIALNSNGTLLRASSQRYRANSVDLQHARLMEALAVLTELEKDPQASALLSEGERVELDSRLTLAGQTLGGFVDAKKLPQAYLKQRVQTEETRGHNWELLRQKAEANGLYFEPLGLDQEATHALLWVSKEDALAPGSQDRHFDGGLLGISNPFGDPRLKKWSGYSVRRTFQEGTPEEHTEELIPLGLYALDYPKVPLLLADFRAFRSAEHREMIRHALTDTASGILGITTWGNWPYFAGSWTWNFVRTRHGDAGNRAARLRAYSEARQWLALDHSLEADLRVELQKRLEVVSINPLEESVFSESKIAAKQYQALLKYAQDPNGLSKRLERDRQAELTRDRHSLRARVGLNLAHVVTFGGFRHREEPDPQALTADLDRYRRAQRQEQFLQTVADSTPQVEVVWNPDQVEHAIDDLRSTGLEAKDTQLLQRVLRQTKDPEARARLEKILENTPTDVGE